MNKCKNCLNSRPIISENGYHSICCLSQKKSMNCMMGRKDYFATLKVNKMDRIITFDCDGNDITCMKTFDALEYPCSACDNEDCEYRETYDDIKVKF